MLGCAAVRLLEAVTLETAQSTNFCTAFKPTFLTRRWLLPSLSECQARRSPAICPWGLRACQSLTEPKHTRMYVVVSRGLLWVVNAPESVPGTRAESLSGSVVGLDVVWNSASAVDRDEKSSGRKYIFAYICCVTRVTSVQFEVGFDQLLHTTDDSVVCSGWKIPAKVPDIRTGRIWPY